LKSWFDASPPYPPERVQACRQPSVTVAAPDHPLASFKRRIPKAALAKHVQLVLIDRKVRYAQEAQ
jgi:hypothetical protein